MKKRYRLAVWSKVTPGSGPAYWSKSGERHLDRKEAALLEDVASMLALRQGHWCDTAREIIPGKLVTVEYIP